MMTTTVRRVGDKVSIDDPKYPGVWTIKSIARVNATLEPENGGRSLRCPMGLLTDPGAAPTPAVPVTASDMFAEGEIVRVNIDKFPGLWVVISDKGAEKLNLAKLGGGGGRYLRVTRRGLVKVDPKDVLKEF